MWPLRSTIPAVKISTDAPSFPLLSTNDSKLSSTDSNPASSASLNVTMPVPDFFSSARIVKKPRTGKKKSVANKLDPIDSSLFSVKKDDEEEALPAPLGTQDDFGEFLLDAVQWL
jgi:hypothetical protein